MARLDGRVAIITGAASGLGLATARRFVTEGAMVVAADRDEARLKNVKEELGEAVTLAVIDITRIQELKLLCDQVSITFGKVDILFANAGVAAFVPADKVDEDTFDRIVQTNLKGTFFTVQALLPVLRDGASVILTASVAGFKGLRHLAYILRRRRPFAVWRGR